MKKDKDIYYSAKAVEIVFTVIDAQFGFVWAPVEHFRSASARLNP
jgi:hypothetical protein